MSAIRRQGNDAVAARAAATSRGTATGSAVGFSTSALQYADLIRVDGAEPLLGLQGETEEERAHRRPDDHVGEGKRLDYRVGDGRPRRNVNENRRLGPS